MTRTFCDICKAETPTERANIVTTLPDTENPAVRVMHQFQWGTHTTTRSVGNPLDLCGKCQMAMLGKLADALSAWKTVATS